ncbi:hypothetical protein [Acinetobacter baumannii]|uniref:hypothetical protein n=1 Tax=Acinetobacter baumannii TaxID=470 RepID=UPI001866943E
MMSLADISALHNLVIHIFVAGAILGFILSGFFKTLLNMWAYRFERPKRIKTDTGFLYFWRGKYYPLEQRNKFIEEHRKKFEHLFPDY